MGSSHHHHHHSSGLVPRGSHMASMSDSEVNQEAKPEVKPEVKPETHINLKVSDGSSEIFFKIKKTTPLRRLMEAFAKRQGKEMDSLRFLYDGIRIQADQTPEDLDMEDNDIIEAHREQIGGSTTTTSVVFPQIPDSGLGDKVKNVRFIERNEWGAQPPTTDLTKMKLPVPYVIISHTVTEFCRTQAECTFHVRYIQTFHIESRQWSDIAYNFLVGGDGYVYVGRSWDFMGAHSFGFNNISIGISFIGTFNTVIPPKSQLYAAQQLIELGIKNGKIAPDYKLLGHRQVSRTLSPGDALYSVIQTWPHWSPSPHHHHHH